MAKLARRCRFLKKNNLINPKQKSLLISFQKGFMFCVTLPCYKLIVVKLSPILGYKTNFKFSQILKSVAIVIMQRYNIR
jgi:hypothetical protein